MPFIKERLKKARQACHATLLDVAESIGVQESTVQKYESGMIKKIDTLTVEKLARAVKCSPGYLMGWEDNQTSVIQAGGNVEKNNINSPGAKITEKAEKEPVRTLSPTEGGISGHALELVKIYESLDFERQVDVINYALKLKKELQKESSAEKDKTRRRK